MRSIHGTGGRAVGALALAALSLSLSACLPGAPSGSSAEPAGTTGTSATPGPASPSPTGGAGPTATVVPSVDLKLTAGQLITAGSMGTPKGTLRVTVHNSGPAAPAITLTFAGIPVKIMLTGGAWESCSRSDNGSVRSAVCPFAAVAAGASMTYEYDFVVTLGQVDLNKAGTVTVAAFGAKETNLADNVASITVCTNGCGG